MGLKTARLTVDRATLPGNVGGLGARLERQAVQSVKDGAPPVDMVLIRPAGRLLSEDEAVGSEPRWNHLVCGLGIQLKDGTVAQGAGQLLITGQRFIGMIDDGTLTGAPALDIKKSGHVYCFSILRSDVYGPEVKKHRLKPSEYFFRSKEDQEVAFRFQIASAMAAIANAKMSLWYDKSMARALSEEGRTALLKT